MRTPVIVPSAVKPWHFSTELGYYGRAQHSGPESARNAIPALQHGLQNLFGFLLPPGEVFHGVPAQLSAAWTVATLELLTGTLLAIGWLTRPIALGLARSWLSRTS